MKLLSLFCLVALLALTACGGGGGEAESTAQTGDQTADQMAETTPAGETADGSHLAQAKMPVEGETISVEGTLGCGHCNYHVGEKCSAAIQTADGAIYILDVAEDSEWFQDRFSGKKLAVEGKVHIVDDLHHIEASSIQPL
jgi:hypothetical protein